MTEILLIRHGETAWNVAMRLQGHLDIPLNEQGERQAAALGAHLQDEVLDAIVSSDLRRASQTAREIARRQGLPLHLDRGLRERCFGGFENLHYGEIERRYPQEFAAWKARDIDAVLPPGERPGETLRQFHERAIATILRLARRHRGRRIALVAHSGVLESAYLAAHGLAPDARYDFPILNARACYELKQGSRSSEKGGSARRGAPLGASPVQADSASPHNAAMRPSRSNPSGSPGNPPPTLLRLLAVARYGASPRLVCGGFPGLRDPCLSS